MASIVFTLENGANLSSRELKGLLKIPQINISLFTNHVGFKKKTNYLISYDGCLQRTNPLLEVL